MEITDDKYISQLPHFHKKRQKKNKKLISELKKMHDTRLNHILGMAEDEEFENIDCLDCGNCCKTMSPLFTKRDINRISKRLNITAAHFVQEYLRTDEDGDYVLQETPCPFLNEDNRCSIYEFRPQACSSYPHMNEYNQKKLLKLHDKNASVCPAVHNIFSKLIDELVA